MLLLGGTSEARDLARALRGKSDLTLSLAGRTRAPEVDGVATRIGGFGGAEAFATYLKTEGIEAVLDATHPFAAEISRRSARAAATCGVHYLLLWRPGWNESPGDQWIRVPDAGAASRVPTPEDRVFLATGRQTLPEFAGMRAERCWCRVVDPPEAPFPLRNGEYLVARPPFLLDQEIALFQRLRVTHLVVKNAGGAASRAKLEAARALELPVLMIDRPDLSDLPHVTSVSGALDWVEAMT